MAPFADEQAALECVEPDEMHMVVPRATGLDVHKLPFTAIVRLRAPGGRSRSCANSAPCGTDCASSPTSCKGTA